MSNVLIQGKTVTNLPKECLVSTDGTQIITTINPATTSVYQFLTDTGSKAGAQSMVGDYSINAGEFFIKPAANEIIVISKMIVHIHDNSKFTAAGYGGGGALTNGIRIVLSQGTDLSTTILEDFTALQTIKSHGIWTQYGGHFMRIDFGAGDDFAMVEFDWPIPLAIHGDSSELFGVILNDDLSALVDHTIYINGTLVGV